MSALRDELEQLVSRYNSPEFIELDPISIPHRFGRKEDVEISGFLAATIAWGNRKSIINNANRMMHLLDNAPFDFIQNHEVKDLRRLEPFVHRTFNGTDFQFFVSRLKNLYKESNGLEGILTSGFQEYGTVKQAISHFHETFFQTEHLSRTRKHVSNPAKGSAAKRLNMYLRWMVRADDAGVDFGIWHGIPMSALSIPLDVHTGNVARELGLLTRKQNDWKAVEELDSQLRLFDERDPVKYDFALFGMGVSRRGRSLS